MNAPIPRIAHAIAGFAAASVLVACHGTSAPIVPTPSQQSIVETGIQPNVPWSNKIKHVVIIFQENRSVDNLFNGYPGADTQTWGLDHKGKRINLIPVSETAPYDPSHSHKAFLTEYDNGKLDGFDLEKTSGCPVVSGQCPPKRLRAYGVVPRSESKPYWDMAKEGGLGDRMFQTNQGPSFPAHQYIISGTSTIHTGSNLLASENPMNPGGGITGGCDSPKGSTVHVIAPNGDESRTVYPCFERQTLMDLLDAKHLLWHYYQFAYKPNLWNAPDAIHHISEEPNFRTEVVAPSSRALTDILNGDLETVDWITPDRDDSDHAQVTDGSGPSWVASLVNAIGTSRYWKDTVIFITWDDWGGWYDHVKPPVYNSYELSFRVPLIVMSPYAKPGYVSHTQHEFGSILKFTEETFGLGSLNTTDVRSDDLRDFFNFKQKPRAFVPIHSPVGPMYFLNKPPSNLPPDDDF